MIDADRMGAIPHRHRWGSRADNAENATTVAAGPNEHVVVAKKRSSLAMKRSPFVERDHHVVERRLGDAERRAPGGAIPARIASKGLRAGSAERWQEFVERHGLAVLDACPASKEVRQLFQRDLDVPCNPNAADPDRERDGDNEAGPAPVGVRRSPEPAGTSGSRERPSNDQRAVRSKLASLTDNFAHRRAFERAAPPRPSRHAVVALRRRYGTCRDDPNAGSLLRRFGLRPNAGTAFL